MKKAEHGARPFHMDWSLFTRFGENGLRCGMQIGGRVPRNCCPWPGRQSALDALVATLVTDGELLAPLPAACAQYIAAVYRRHALAKSVLVATLADGRLEGSLAHNF